MENHRDRYKGMFDRALDGIWVADLSGNILDVNSAYCKMAGYNKEEILSLKIFDLDLLETEEETKRHIRLVLEKGSDRFETKHRHKDGATLDVEVATSVFNDEKTQLVTILKDITSHKKAQEDLRKEHAFLKALVDTAQSIILVLGTDGKILNFNPYMEEICGYKVEEVKGKDWFETFLPESEHPRIRGVFSQVAKGISVRNNENPFITKDGSLKYIQWNGAALKDKDGKIEAVLSTGLDITARIENEKRTFETLGEIENSKKLLNHIINLLPVRIFWKDKDLKLLGCNKAFARDAGKESPEELLGKSDYEMSWRDNAEKYRKDDRDVIDNKKMKLNFEEPQTTPSGEEIILSTSKVPLVDSDGNVIGVLGTYAEVTEQKKFHRKMMEQKEEMDQILQKMLNAFVVFDSVYDEKGNFISYRFVYINNAYEEITGVKNNEVKGKTVHEVWPETEDEWIKRYGEVATSGVSQKFELYHGPTKKFYYCNVFRPWKENKQFCVVFEDTTIRRNSEEKMKNLVSFPSENPDPVLRIGQDGKVLYSNKRGELLLGAWNCDVGQTAPDKWKRIVSEALKSGKVTREEEEEEEEEGRVFLITVSPFVQAGYVNLYAHDITERNRAKLNLQQNLKDLQHFRDVTVDRENVMIDLKKEVNSLCRELGKEPVHDLSFLE